MHTREAAFEFVRDTIPHSVDSGDLRVTWRASDVLDQRTGICYAKAHALAALLRAEGIPAALCYQRLATTTAAVTPSTVWSPCASRGAGHRQDPRGNKPGVDAQFSLDGERLAWVPGPESNEMDYPVLYAAPHPAGAPGRSLSRRPARAVADAPHRALKHGPAPSRPRLRSRRTMTLTLTVSDEVRALAPGFTHVAVEAHGLVNGPSNEASSALLDDAARRLAARLDGRAPHEDPHIAAWRATYTAFGAKPSRTRNSAEALARRALTDAGLPRINLLVDLYNAISVAHLIPVGGEDTDRIRGGCGSCAPPATSRSRPWPAARRPWSTPSRARSSGATTRASPAGAGTGARACAPGSPRSRSTRCSCWSAWPR